VASLYCCTADGLKVWGGGAVTSEDSPALSAELSSKGPAFSWVEKGDTQRSQTTSEVLGWRKRDQTFLRQIKHLWAGQLNPRIHLKEKQLSPFGGGGENEGVWKPRPPSRQRQHKSAAGRRAKRVTLTGNPVRRL